MPFSSSVMSEALIVIPVACAIIEGPEGVLCAQRSAMMSLPLVWEFPGGKIEAGETAEGALLREIREELQVEIIIGQALTYADHSYVEGRVIRLFPFVCRLAGGGDPIPREHAALRWVMREELRSLDWAAADVPVLEDYLKGNL
ncbi:MAG: (deoxy)nucleoside triphosphate pyrophosphohydrolase [bacterium]|jgi:8-oxo-dGTP diphosphatase